MAFHPGGSYAYLLTEEGANLVSFQYDGTTGLLSSPVTIKAAPSGTGAHIMVHPTRPFVYVCVRAYDSVGVFEIDAQGRAQPRSEIHTGVANPWDFTIEPTGNYLVLANDGNSTVKVFKVDQTTGALTPVGNGATADHPHFAGVLR
jgi:6-phosphogluconolactonase